MEEGNHDIGILIYAHMKAHGAVEVGERKNNFTKYFDIISYENYYYIIKMVKAT